MSESVSRVRDPSKMIIVTGGAGFIGSHLIRELNKQGKRNILLVDDLSDPRKIENIKDLKFKDYTDKSKFIEIFGILAQNNLVECVYHFGAESSTSCGDGKYLMENNYQYTCSIMDICAASKLALVYASSASVYGDQTKEWGKFEAQSDDYIPQSYYALSKLQADKYSRQFSQNPQNKIIGLRYFNVISEGQHEQHKDGMKSALCWMTEQYIRNESIALFEGLKDFLRDFIHIDEAIKTTLNAMIQGKTGVYNVGMGRAKSFYDLALEVVTQNHGTEEDIEYIPIPEDVARGYQSYTFADMSNSCFGCPGDGE